MTKNKPRPRLAAGDLEILSGAERLTVLRHELAHFQRADLWKSLAVRFAALPQWFNPLAWLAIRRFDDAAEWACDAEARGCDAATLSDYAQALLQLGQPPRSPLACHPAASARHVAERIRRLSQSTHADSVRNRLAVVGVGAAMAALGIVRPEVAARPPEADADASISASPAEDGDQVVRGPRAATDRGQLREPPASIETRPAAARGETSISAAIRRGCQFLKSRQSADGDWPVFPGQPGGITALATLALFESGTKVELPARPEDCRAPIRTGEYRRP